MDNTDSDSSRDVPPVSLSSMVSTLAPVAVVSTVYMLIFLVLRKSNRRYYAPRTYLGSLRENERSPPLEDGLVNWLGSFWRIPDVYALQHQSLDAYLYIRFLRIATAICFVGCCITWPVLFPINATGTAGKKELDILTYGNIDKDTQTNRYYAHVLVGWAFYGFVMCLIMRECIFYINLRQAFLLSPFYSNRISSRTVLFTSVPTPYLNEAKLRKALGPGVKNVWMTYDAKAVDKAVKERDQVAMRLEKAEIKLIQLANKGRQHAIGNGGSVTEVHGSQFSGDAESGRIAARWVPKKKRPTHRRGFLGLVGKKVDTINWCRQELERLIPAAEETQAKYRAGSYTKMPGVFVEFTTQAEAEGAAQILAHHHGLHITPKYIGIRPDEIVWKSLAVPWWQIAIRRYAVYAFITAMIVFWAAPVAVVGFISNVNELRKLPWLTWLDRIPRVIMGVITGLLPSVALSTLMSSVPVIIRLCAKIAGEPSLSRVELFTQNAYFVFQVVQVFLITTMTSSAAAVVIEIKDNPSSATTILAQNLPKSSNFYISYFIVQGLSIATSVLTQVVGFIIFSVVYKFFTSTPRALYTKWANLSAISWGSTLPVYTNIVVIAITYATIAPLMLGWATIGLGLFYLAWRYEVLFVTDTKVDTRGLIYPRAIKQLFTGIYLAELCMIGLLGASAQPGPLILMFAFFIFSILFHISLNNVLNPLLYHLPLSLLAEDEPRLFGTETTGGVDPVPSSSNEKSTNRIDQVEGANGGRKPNFLIKFLKPWVYSDYSTLRTLAPPRLDADEYPDEVARDAYFPPSVTSQTPLLWIPSDAAGVSKQEVAHTNKVIPITDEGCELDGKGQLVWDKEMTRPPVWEENVYY